MFSFQNKTWVRGVVLLVVSYVLSPVITFGFQNEPDGFGGIKWGTEFTTLSESMTGLSVLCCGSVPHRLIGQSTKTFRKASQWVVLGEGSESRSCHIWFEG